jgi:outer membrane protein insertion porin family
MRHSLRVARALLISLAAASLALACTRSGAGPASGASAGGPAADIQIPHPVEVLGRKYTLRGVEVEGNAHLAASAIRPSLLMTTMEVIDQNVLERDVLMISALYYDQGFLEVKVSPPRFSETAGGDLTITIRVDEGAQYTVASFDVYELVEGGPHAPPMAGWNKPGFQGKVFHRDQIMRWLAGLRTLYRDAGYAFVEADPKTDLDRERREVTIEVPIFRGSIAHFGKIQFIGNRTIDESVLRKEIAIAEGQLYTETGLTKSGARLRELGWFVRVDIATEQGTKPDLVDVHFEVQESPGKGPQLAQLP